MKGRGLSRPGFRGRTVPPSLLRRIAREECEAANNGVTPELALSRNRYAAVFWVRAKIIKRLHRMGAYSMPTIARALDRDHTTILGALRRQLRVNPPVLKLKKPVLRGELPVFVESPHNLLTALPPSEITVPLARLMGARA